MKKYKNNQSLLMLCAHSLFVLLVLLTTLLYGSSRMATYLRQEAYQLFPSHIWIEETLCQNDDFEDVIQFLQMIPQDNEYIYVYDNEAGTRAIYYNDSTVMNTQYADMDELLLPVLNSLLKLIDLGNVYNAYIDQQIDIQLAEIENSTLIEIGHKIETDDFSGEIYAYRNVTKSLLEEFKNTLGQCFVIFALSCSFIILNYKLMRNAYYTPLEKMTEHYLKMSRFHLEPFTYDKQIIPEVQKTVNAVNKTMLDLQEGLKESKSFLDEMVHEIKNPAHNIKNEIELIDDILPDADEEIKTRLQSVMNETTNITSLLSSIKIIYDMNYLGASPPDSWLNPIEKIQSIYEEYKVKHPDRQFHFKYHINPNIQIWIDPGSIELMIRNLLDNAIKYSKDGSIIFIGIREHKEVNRVLIDVINSDSSIEYNNLGKIFGKYYRTNRAKAQTDGIGIGLWLVHSIAEIYQANIHVQSSTNTTGFVFSTKHYKDVTQETNETDNKAISS
ncbi:sensor histidine kinase [Pradoshia sp.]